MFAEEFDMVFYVTLRSLKKIMDQAAEQT